MKLAALLKELATLLVLAIIAAALLIAAGTGRPDVDLLTRAFR